MDSISTNDLVKYAVIVGLVYTILKLVPSQNLSDKDLLLILFVVAFGIICVDCFVIKKIDNFVNIVQPQVAQQVAQPQVAQQVAQPQVAQPQVAQPQVAQPQVAQPQVAQQVVQQQQVAQQSGQQVARPVVQEQRQPVTPVASSCGVEVEKVKRDLELKISQLTQELTKRLQSSDSGVGSKYLSSLINELNERGVLTSTEIEQIKTKLNSKLLSMEEVIDSLEKLKSSSKPKDVSKVTDKTDHKFNELPSEFYSPMGDKIANDWDNQYTILNTNRWQVPMARPPLCINTNPCKVCPTDTNYLPIVTTKDWDESRKVTNVKINKDWVNAQSEKRN